MLFASPYLFVIFSLLLVSSNGDPYEYFKMAQQWPPTFCSVNLCKPGFDHNARFYIHGLWPTNHTDPQPRDCKGVGPNKPASLLPEKWLPTHFTAAMNPQWPNLLLNIGNYKFWEAQWRNHGTCSSFSGDVYAYFNRALKIKNIINLDNWLKRAQIVPHSTRTYKKDLFNSTIYGNIKAYPELTCVRKSTGSYLLEIRVCLDQNGSFYRNCTESSNTCGDDIIWPL